MRYLVACGVVVVGTLFAPCGQHVRSGQETGRRRITRFDAPPRSDLSDLKRKDAKGGRSSRSPRRSRTRTASCGGRLAAQAQGNIGPDAKDAIPGLRRSSTIDNAPCARGAAINALAKLYGATPPVLSALTKRCRRRATSTRPPSTASAAAGPTAIPALAGVIKNPKIAANLRSRAIEALPADKEARPALPALVDAVGKPAPGGQEGQAFRRSAIAAVKPRWSRRPPTSTAVVRARRRSANDDNRNNRQYQKTGASALKSVQRANDSRPRLPMSGRRVGDVRPACPSVIYPSSSLISSGRSAPA